MELGLLLLGVVGRIGVVQCQADSVTRYLEDSQTLPEYSGWGELFAEAEKSAGFEESHNEGRPGVLAEVSVAGPEGRSGSGHGHGHSGHGTACIVKGSYCQCHYCKCEHGHV